MGNTSVAVRLCRPLLAFGQPALQVLERHGVGPSDLDVTEGRVDYMVLIELLEVAHAALGSPTSGLLAAQLDGRTLDVLEYIGRSSLTGLEALEVVARYQRLLHDACRMRVDRGDRTVVVHLGCKEGVPYPPPVVEFFAASLVFGLHRLGVPIGGIEVAFAHAAPRTADAYGPTLRATVRFDAADARVTVPRHELEQPLPGSDPALCAVLERHVERMLGRLPRANLVTERVRHRLAAELRGGEPTIERAAVALKMSPRTLRRRLTDEKTTFQDLLDELRHHLALAYLDEPNLGTEQIAFLLGFSEASAFRRAFRRWTGTTVPDFRRAHPPGTKNAS
jgi:AraC-like DNA-binding protein